MELRLHIDNGFYMREFSDTAEGLKDAKEFRKNHEEFKGRKIRKIIQAFPSKILINKTYIILT